MYAGMQHRDVLLQKVLGVTTLGASLQHGEEVLSTLLSDFDTRLHALFCRYRHDDQESSRQETMTTGLGRAALLQTISLIEQMQMDSSLKVTTCQQAWAAPCHVCKACSRAYS